MNDIQNKIQAILFWKNEPLKVEDLAKILKIDKETVVKESQNLAESLKDQGVVLMIHENEMRLVTSKETSDLIDELEKTERSKELSKAALETLAIILYKGPIRRSEVDYIRGVNSQFIIRHLEVRGLIEKEQSEEDARVFLYKASLDLLALLGITRKEDLPEFDSLTQKLIESEVVSADIQEETDSQSA